MASRSCGRIHWHIGCQEELRLRPREGGRCRPGTLALGVGQLPVICTTRVALSVAGSVDPTCWHSGKKLLVERRDPSQSPGFTGYCGSLRGEGVSGVCPATRCVRESRVCSQVGGGLERNSETIEAVIRQEVDELTHRQGAEDVQRSFPDCDVSRGWTPTPA